MLQEQLEQLEFYSKQNRMVLNKEKIKAMIFNNQRNIDVMPILTFENGDAVEIIEETKILGIIINSNMNWKTNTKKIIADCFSKMWMLRNLKNYGATDDHLSSVYREQIRSKAEYCCTVWNAGLTSQEVKSIERIQRTAVAINRGEHHTNYSEATSILKLETLEIRRKNLCLKFALKMYKSQKYSTWFKNFESEVNTRSSKLPLREVKCMTKQYLKSPLPYMTNLLNQQLKVNLPTK